MAVNFGILTQQPTIGERFAMGQQEAQRNLLAQQQLEQSQMQTQMTRMQFEQAQRDRAALEKMAQSFAQNGHTGSLDENFDKMIASGIPQYVQIGITGKQKLAEQRQFAAIMGPGFGAAPSAPSVPAAPSAPSAGPAPIGTTTPGAPAAVGATAPAAPTPIGTAPANALAPAAAPSVDVQINQLRAKRDALLGLGTTQAIAAAKALDTDIVSLQRQHVVAPGGAVVSPSGQVIYQAPTKPTSIGELIAERDKLPAGDPRRAVYDAAITKATTHAPATTVNVSTEKKYGESFGTKLAEVDINKMTTAEKAPQLAESAIRILDLANRPEVFVGPISNVKLNIARAFNVAGASNDEVIANTEKLIAATGQATIDAIKSSGLGSGQGFTDKDLKFLQGVAGGTIALNKETLTELATLQHRAAARSAETWNKRAKEIPKEVAQGTGIDITPVVVPPLPGSQRAGEIPRGPAPATPSAPVVQPRAGRPSLVEPAFQGAPEAVNRERLRILNEELTKEQMLMSAANPTDANRARENVAALTREIAAVQRQAGLATAPPQAPAMQPPAAAPIYARNPKTGQRIMSIDGGNTWAPAR